MVGAFPVRPANWLLWRMYSALTDRLGLDSVANLLLNLAIFVSIGLCAGVAYGLMLRRHAGAVAAAEVPGGGGRHGEEDTGG